MGDVRPFVEERRQLGMRVGNKSDVEVNCGREDQRQLTKTLVSTFCDGRDVSDCSKSAVGLRLSESNGSESQFV
jgi:hypothetical protein